MQLDCAIRSFTRHCKYVNDSLTVKVLYTTSNDAHERQYRTLAKNYPSIEFVKETDFKNNLLQVLTSSEYVLFLVDDNIFVNDFSTDHIIDVLRQYPNAIGFSLRLGRNTNYCYMLRKQQALPSFSFCRQWRALVMIGQQLNAISVIPLRSPVHSTEPLIFCRCWLRQITRTPIRSKSCLTRTSQVFQRVARFAVL